MASFTVYQDQENFGHNHGNKSKDAALKNRTVLGVLSSNSNPVESQQIQKGTNDFVTKRDVSQALLQEKAKWPFPQKEKIKEDEVKKASGRLPLIDINSVTSESLKDDDESVMTVENNTPCSSISDMYISRTSSQSFSSKESVTEKSDSPVTSSLHEGSQSSTTFYDYSVYIDDIYKYLRQIETQHRAKAYYMRRQPDVTYSMRSILVDWLVEVGEEYKLHTETLFMTVNYIDRFLSCMAVVRAKLQLLGTSAMFIASKFEEIYPPDVGEFTYITDDTYSKKQVLRMEHLILKVLSFDLSNPTIYTFVLHLCVSTKLPDKVKFLATYICELSLLEGDPYLDFNPSLIACGAIALARHTIGYNEVWPLCIMNASGYNLFNLAPVITHLNKTHSKAQQLPQGAVREKYKSTKYQQVAQIPAKRLVISERESLG